MTPLARAYSLCLQGKVRQAMVVLRRAGPRLSAPGQRLLAGLARELRQLLARHPARPPAADADLDELQRVLGRRLRARGFCALLGRISPHRHLHLWRTQTERAFRVDLPAGPQKVSVVLMGGFLEQGWSHYATLGRYYAGGWAGDRKLFCVRKAYDLGSERFRISYLAHEAQHFQDYRRFPGLDGGTLEYRAKLTELALSRSPNLLARSFFSKADPDRQSPHARAAYELVRKLLRELTGGMPATLPRGWPDPPAARLREAARRLLASSDRELTARRRRRRARIHAR